MRLPTKFQKALICVGPAFTIAFVMGMFSLLPKLAMCKAEQEKLLKLLSQSKHLNIADQTRRLSELREESDKLTQQLAKVTSSGPRFVSKPGLSGTSLEVGTPAQSIAELIRLLEGHGMKCLSCKTNLQSKSNPSDSAKTAGLNRTDGNENSAASSRREVTIEIEGSYVQLQQSLSELRGLHGHFEITSIAMNDANTQSPSRFWKLKVIV